MMRTTTVLWAWMALLLLAATPVAAVGGLVYPLLDGVCDEYSQLESRVYELPHGVQLNLVQDADYVWLCYSLPPESYGTLDLRIETPALEDPLNLHVSAQLGEWRADHPDEAPVGPSSDIWWRIEGWSANSVRINGTRETPQGPRPHFLADVGRELQLSKSRFGRGEWRLRFEIRNVQVGGEDVTILYPAQEGDGPRALTFVAR